MILLASIASLVITSVAVGITIALVKKDLKTLH